MSDGRASAVWTRPSATQILAGSFIWTGCSGEDVPERTGCAGAKRYVMWQIHAKRHGSFGRLGMFSVGVLRIVVWRVFRFGLAAPR